MTVGKGFSLSKEVIIFHWNEFSIIVTARLRVCIIDPLSESRSDYDVKLTPMKYDDFLAQGETSGRNLREKPQGETSGRNLYRLSSDTTPDIKD